MNVAALRPASTPAHVSSSLFNSFDGTSSLSASGPLVSASDGTCSVSGSGPLVSASGPLISTSRQLDLLHSFCVESMRDDSSAAPSTIVKCTRVSVGELESKTGKYISILAIYNHADGSSDLMLLLYREPGTMHIIQDKNHRGVPVASLRAFKMF